MDLNEVAVFTKVIQAGNFSRAAEQLGMPKSTVSAKVSLLEKRLGVTLIQRTTRKLHVTPAGEAYFRKCVEGLGVIEAAEREASSAQKEPQGILRITAPTDLGQGAFIATVQKYLKMYPRTRIELIVTDRVIDLVAEGVDLAVRAGALEDSSLISRSLGMSHLVAVVSPAYVKARGRPAHPRELAREAGKHDCVTFSPFGDAPWELSNGKETLGISVAGRVSGNDLWTLKNLALLGLGVALLPPFVCREELRTGKLVRVLPQWQQESDPMHLVYPAQRFLQPKLQAFLALMAEEFRNRKAFE